MTTLSLSDELWVEDKGRGVCPKEYNKRQISVINHMKQVRC